MTTTPVKSAIKSGLIIAVSAFFFVACSGNKAKRNAEDATSALINENKNIIAFGHISVQTLLDKVDYKSLPKISAILAAELPSWQRGIKLDHPIYFAVQAPMGQDGTPELVYGLMDVNNKDSLIDKFTSMGYAIETSGEISYFQESDVTVGVRNELAIVLSKKGDYDGKKLIEQAFLATEGDKSEGEASSILQSKGDIVSGLSLERLYGTSNTALAKLDDIKKKELEGLMKEGFIKMTAQFENGKATFKTTNLFSPALKDRLFFKEDGNASVIKKLGTGDAWMGISANIDMRKLESLINDFAPDAAAKLKDQLPGQFSMALSTMGENPLAKMFSGDFGFVAVGTPQTGGGMIPQFNFYLGLGSKGDLINTMLNGYAGMLGFPKKGDTYETGGMAIAPRKDGIYGYTIANESHSSLKIPGFANQFGKNTFCMFVDLGHIDVNSFELEGEAQVLEIMESFVINVDKDGSETILVTKDKSTNILKQVGMYFTKKGEERMNELSM